MKTILFFSILFITSLSFSQQAGTMDTSYITGYYANHGVGGEAIQPDGKIILAGALDIFNDKLVRGLVRLNPDLTVDPTFNTGNEFDTHPSTIALQADGKILLGGGFKHVNGVYQGAITRLNADGSRDTTFVTGDGFETVFPDIEFGVEKMIVQPDGKILVCGRYSTFNNISRKRIARLNADGSIDLTFNPGTGAGGGFSGGDILDMALQSDGKIIIVGYFLFYNGTTIKRIARLNTNGSLDLTFNPGISANDDIYSVSVQADNKIIAGGHFTFYGLLSHTHLVRINTDGTADETFNPTGLGYVNATKILPDGRIVIGQNGNNAVPVTAGIKILLANGDYDTSFHSGESNESCEELAYKDGYVYVAGGFDAYKENSRNYFFKIDLSGNLADTEYFGGITGILSCAAQSDHKMIMAGNRLKYDGKDINYMIRLNPDASPDTTFNTGIGFDDPVFKIAVTDDDKIYAAGDFNHYNDTSSISFIRLTKNGHIDQVFGFTGGIIYDFTEQEDGKIIAVGSFTTYGGVGRNHIVRFNPDGTLDESFEPGGGPDTQLLTGVAAAPDGKIWVVGDIRFYDGHEVKKIVRLNSDGSLDETALIGSGANQLIDEMSLLNDKIYISGSFTSYDGVTQNHFTRLNLDGSRDTSFHIGTGFGNYYGIESIMMNGSSILLGGAFNSYNGEEANNIIQLHADGSRDLSFMPQYNIFPYNGVSVTGIEDMVFDADSNIYLTGYITNYDHRTCNGIVRVFGKTPSCDPPTAFYEDEISSSKARLHWTADDIAVKYRIQYRKLGTMAWTQITTPLLTKKLTGLLPATTYQYRIRSLCDGTTSSFSALDNFTTLPLRTADDETVKEIFIYPNPAYDIFSVDLSGFSQQVQLTICDINGRKVYADVINITEDGYVFRPVVHLNSGIYYVTVYDDVQAYSNPVIIY